MCPTQTDTNIKRGKCSQEVHGILWACGPLWFVHPTFIQQILIEHLWYASLRARPAFLLSIPRFVFPSSYLYSSQPPFWYPLPLALYSSKLPVLGNYYIYNYIIIAKYYIYNYAVIAELLTSCFMLLYVFLIFHSIPEPSPSTWCIRHSVNTK